MKKKGRPSEVIGRSGLSENLTVVDAIRRVAERPISLASVRSVRDERSRSAERSEAPSPSPVPVCEGEGGGG